MILGTALEVILGVALIERSTTIAPEHTLSDTHGGGAIFLVGSVRDLIGCLRRDARPVPTEAKATCGSITSFLAHSQGPTRLRRPTADPPLDLDRYPYDHTDMSKKATDPPAGHEHPVDPTRLLAAKGR